ncbi:MAG: 30S ribosomal protein S6 [Actinobacteria bacterium]|nr:30S ribosomal protein S6 [Actinomycetota bacterium]
MRSYELMFILKPELDEEATAAAVDKYTNLIATQGGNVSNVDKWGKRRLAYEVGGYRDGYYVVVNFAGEPEASKEVDRVLKISDEVIKHMVIKLDD